VQKGVQVVSETELKPVKVALEEAPQVAIIVLNWNAWDITAEALDALSRLQYPRYEVILVDNGSSTSSRGLENSWPNLIFVQTGSNRGYTGGNNAGIKVALARNAEFVLILNNDVLLQDSDTVTKLIRASRARPSAGILAPHVASYTEEGALITDSHHGKMQSLLSRLVLGTRHPRSVSGPHPFRYFDDEVESVSHVCGCAMLISRQLLEHIGYFDERFFMYDEEYDFCLRGIDAGFLVMQVHGTCVARRNVCAQNAMPGYRTYLFGRNRFLIARKRLSWKQTAIFIGLHIISTLKLGVTLAGDRRWNELTGLLYGFKDGILGRWGITPKLACLLIKPKSI
jgi:GT2 family glycosyltransferase